MRSRRPEDPARAHRRKVKAETLAQLAKLQGQPELPRGVRRGAVATLRQHGLQLVLGGQPLGAIAPAYAGPSAPLQLAYATSGQAQPHRVVAPSYLAAVRMMPCSICGKGRPFYQQLQLGTPQSEANHHPGRGRSGGGSDLETHPVCVPSPFGCHGQITENKVPHQDATCSLAVALTLHQVVAAIREGRLQCGILLAMGVEAVLASRV